MTRRLVQVALVALCLAASVVASSAQVFTGRIDVTAKDGTGAVLPGVTVEISGAQLASQVTDARGEAHFLNLAPGRYTLTAKLSGFNQYKNDNVPVGAGSVIELPVTMSVGNVTEAVNVTAATPVIEAKKQTISTNVTLDELQNIPSARDPWVVLQTVPGVVVDRVNVGGAESGQQSVYQAKGATTTDNTWNIDGVAVTDMAALGSSPTYYDFDMFQEMQVTTGGADPANPTPGVQLNFILRSGTNKWRVGGRYYFENNSLQSDNLGDDLTGTLTSYNRIEFYKDYGFEGGGPLIADRLWAWGAYGKTNPALEIYTLRGATDGTVVRKDPGCKGDAKSYPALANTYNISARDCTILENYSSKVDFKINNAWRSNFTYFRGNKQKFGRGASATRPSVTTFDQDGPTDMFKGEVNYTLSDRTFLTGRYAYTSNGFTFTPVGGFGTQPFLDNVTGVWGNTYAFYATDRPQNSVNLEALHFRGNHELKFGFGYRKVSVSSQSGWPGGVLNILTSTGADGNRNYLAQFTRDANNEYNSGYTSAFVGDQISMNRLTVNLGLRWDRQVANLNSSTVAANPWTSLLPELTANPISDATVWNSVTPRLGLTYALNESRKTIVRASYGMFASQLLATRAGVISNIPATSTGSGYVYYFAHDDNGDLLFQPSEARGFAGVSGFDENNPTAGSANRIGDYKVPMTHELLFGVEHELMRNFGISANVTWRKMTNFNWLQYDGVNADDYHLVDRLTGSDPAVGQFDVPLYVINEDAVPAGDAQVFEHRQGYSQRYWGFELAATKRMSDRWMMRAGWSTNDHKEYFDGNSGIADPTPLVPQASLPNSSANLDGGRVITQTSGSGKGSVYIVLPKYQFIMSGAYNAKWDINLGVNYVMRQGYALPYFQGASLVDEDGVGLDPLATTGKNVLLQPEDVAGHRLPAVHSFDARINKAVTWQRLRLNFDVDIFNLFNSNTPLARQIDFSQARFDSVREIMNPRVVRLGVRVAF